MASYTSSQSGNWSAAATWAAVWAASTAQALGSWRRPTAANGYLYVCTVAGTTGATEPTWPTVLGNTVVDGTVTWTCSAQAPGDGDTATIAATHTVTVDIATTVGTAGASGTAAITLSSSSSALVINAPLTAKGDIANSGSVSGSNNGTTTSGSLTFNTPSGSTYKLSYNLNGSSFNFSGVSNATQFVLTTTGAGGNFYLGGSFGGPLTLLYVKWYNSGSATQTAVTAGGSYDVNITHTLFHTVGDMQFSSSSATAQFIFSYIDVRNPVNTSNNRWIFVNYTTAKTSGTRTFDHVTVYSTVAKDGWVTIVGGVVLNTFYTYNARLGSSALTQSEIKNLFFLVDNGVGYDFIGLKSNSATTLHDCAFWTNVENPHYIGEGSGGTISPNTVYGNVFDGNGYVAINSGDLYFPNAAGTFRNNININLAGTLCNLLNVAGVLTCLNNTSYNSYGLSVGETSGAATVLAAARNNLFVSQANGIYSDSAFVRQSSFSCDYNAYYNMTDPMDLNHPTLVPSNAYLGFPVKTRVTVAATTGTNDTTLVASAATFITSGVQAGDYLYKSNTEANTARIQSVDSETQLTLVSPGIVGLVSGNSVQCRDSYWATAGAKYGDADKGANDLSQNPNFRDATRTGATWDTSLGGAGTLASAAAELMKLNGFDSSGAAATYNTNYSAANFIAYIQYGFTPTNSTLKGAGSPADGSPDIGAVAVYVATGMSRSRIVNSSGFGSIGRGAYINAGGI